MNCPATTNLRMIPLFMSVHTVGDDVNDQPYDSLSSSTAPIVIVCSHKDLERKVLYIRAPCSLVRHGLIATEKSFHLESCQPVHSEPSDTTRLLQGIQEGHQELCSLVCPVLDLERSLSGPEAACIYQRLPLQSRLTYTNKR
jgi:hypothetical protein